MCLLEPGTGTYTVGQKFTNNSGMTGDPATDTPMGFEYTVEVRFLVESNSRSDTPIIDATFTTPSSGVTTDGILDSLISQINERPACANPNACTQEELDAQFTAIKIGSGIYFTREQTLCCRDY